MYVRPRHDAQAIAHARTTTCTNQEKGGLGWAGYEKLCELTSPVQNSK